MSKFTALDHQFMSRAIALAKRGRFSTSPNPNVGCVIVKNGQVIGEGWHIKAGQGHAEVNALSMAGDDARGARCYVTLEPCSHYGRTPPCAQALIDAGVTDVIAAMVDPNPQVSGRGLAMLENAGITTASGLLETQARALNRGFIKRMQTGRPFVRVKMASSIDGQTAMASGESKWITGASARADVQAYRAQSCAILTGANTVVLDDASLNVRYEELPHWAQKAITADDVRQPLCVVTDTRGRLHPDLKLFRRGADVLIATTENGVEPSAPGVDFVRIQPHNEQVDLEALLLELGERQINELWVEAGASLAGALLERHLVDEIILYQAPKIMGAGGRGLFVMPSLTHLADAINLSIIETRQVGSDLKLTLQPDY